MTSTAVIDSFSGPHRFLSNFTESVVHFDGITFPTVEHAFQAAKTLDPDERETVRACETPGRAKRAGRRVTLRPGWDDMRINVMRKLLIDKFTHPELALALVATGDATLIEGNTWGDRFWGVCGGRGENHLGQLLMEIRSTLQSWTNDDGVIVFPDGDPHTNTCCTNPDTSHPDHDCVGDPDCFELHYIVDCSTCGSRCFCEV